MDDMLETMYESSRYRFGYSANRILKIIDRHLKRRSNKKTYFFVVNNYI